MSLIIASGSNLLDPVLNLRNALDELKKHFSLIAQSSLYESDPLGPQDQNNFINQVLEFKTPVHKPHEILDICLTIENNMGRVRKKKWGPRIIDLDIIFIGSKKIQTKELIIPHAHWSTRNFVLLPLSELPFAKNLNMPCPPSDLRIKKMGN